MIPPSDNSRFVQLLKNYLAYWIEETAVLTHQQIQKLDEDFENVVQLLDTTIHYSEEIRLTAVTLLTQCFFWVERGNHIFEWRPLMERYLAALPPNYPHQKFQLHKQLSQLYRLEENYDQCTVHLHLAQAVADQLEEPLSQGEVQLNWGQIYLAQHTPQQAILTLTQAQPLLNGRSPRLEAILYQLLGVYAIQIGDYETAVYHLNHSLQFQFDTQYHVHQAKTTLLLASAYRALQQLTTALTQFKKIEPWISRLNIVEQIELHLHQGAIYYDLEKWEKAKEKFNEALFQANGVRSLLRHQAHLHNNLGCVYRNLHDWGKALNHFRLSINLFQELADDWQLANVLSGMSKMYELNEEYERSLTALQTAVAHLHKLHATPPVQQRIENYQTRIGHLKSQNK